MLRQCAVFITLAVTVQAQMEGFIVGGTYANINKFPHAAFLSIKCSGSYTSYWLCGSSLINQEVLLTAAHCVARCGAGSAIISSLGHVNRYKGYRKFCRSFLVHERFNTNIMNFDIALIKMSSPIKFNDVIRRVAIMKHPPIQEPAFVAGWGLIQENTNKTSILLKQVDQQVLSFQRCREIFRIMPMGTICAKSVIPHFYPSQGDSGSGLIVRDYIAIGVVSYKVPAMSNNIIIYTDVAHLYDWIEYQSQSLHCHNRVYL